MFIMKMYEIDNNFYRLMALFHGLKLYFSCKPPEWLLDCKISWMKTATVKYKEKMHGSEIYAIEIDFSRINIELSVRQK